MGLLDAPVNYDRSGLFIPRTVRSRAEPNLRVLFREDTRAWPPGMWNDGAGDAYRDGNIMFGGRPTYRLSLDGNTNSGTDPGRTAATGGVVFKRRIQDGFTGIFALELWFRFTSTNNNSVGNPLFSMSVYNRTGTDTDGTSTAWHGRFWLNQMGNNKNIHGFVLDGTASGTAGAAVWADVIQSHQQNGAGSHTFMPSNGGLDRAGGWHYAYLAVDLLNKKYVGCKLDGETYVDLSTYNLDATSSTGAAMMHFSTEYSSNTGTYRFMNIAQVTGYGWN